MQKKSYKTLIKKFIYKNFLILPFLGIFVVLWILYPQQMKVSFQYIDWKTILSLTALITVATGLHKSMYFHFVAERIIKKANCQRKLAVLLVVTTAFLSTFLTNDIALFIVAPLTLSICELIEEDAGKLLIFEALAANAGSSLTPIGNPQNLYLWHKWGQSFAFFTLKMFPLFAILLLILILFVILVFPHKKLHIIDNNRKVKVHKKLFYVSLFLMISFVFFLEMGYYVEFLVLVMFVYILFFRKVMAFVDWMLVFMFGIVFWNFHTIANVEWISNLKIWNLINTPLNTYIASIVTSQVISNVPASVFISKFSHMYVPIIYGVNVGGNGLVISSFANIIALRFSKKQSVWINFHYYSIIYLLITTIAVGVLLLS